MRKSTVGGIAAVALAAFGGTAWFHQRADGKEAPAYRTAAVTRGSLKATVSATGTLQAVRTVQVGTQVSGQVSAILADFNDHVKKGQLLARIDPTLQQQAVEDAQAQLERAQATLKQAQDDFNRNKQLFDARVITASEFGTYQSNFSVQQASVKSAQIALDRAKQNLAYTNIYSPIDGVIVARSVDVGQTVASSLSAPTLFMIANDLGSMQILASVDESDIGQIKEGQSVNFTVQSYPNQQFTGRVEQVRLQSTTTDNVVNYTAVVNVKNDAGKLLPGMTATVAFTTASANNVLTVPNAALRIKPTEAMQAEVSANRKKPATTPDSTQKKQWSANRAAGATRTAPTMVWYEDANKKLHVARVTVGLSDGSKTEISGKDITEGMQVVIGVENGGATTTTAQSAASTNPFQPQRPGVGMGGGRPPGR